MAAAAAGPAPAPAPATASRELEGFAPCDFFYFPTAAPAALDRILHHLQTHLAAALLSASTASIAPGGGLGATLSRPLAPAAGGATAASAAARSHDPTTPSPAAGRAFAPHAAAATPTPAAAAAHASPLGLLKAAHGHPDASASSGAAAAAAGPIGVPWTVTCRRYRTAPTAGTGFTAAEARDAALTLDQLTAVESLFMLGLPADATPGLIMADAAPRRRGAGGTTAARPASTGAGAISGGEPADGREGAGHGIDGSAGSAAAAAAAAALTADCDPFAWPSSARTTTTASLITRGPQTALVTTTSPDLALLVPRLLNIWALRQSLAVEGRALALNLNAALGAPLEAAEAQLFFHVGRVTVAGMPRGLLVGFTTRGAAGMVATATATAAASPRVPLTTFQRLRALVCRTVAFPLPVAPGRPGLPNATLIGLPAAEVAQIVSQPSPTAAAAAAAADHGPSGRGAPGMATTPAPAATTTAAIAAGGLLPIPPADFLPPRDLRTHPDGRVAYHAYMLLLALRHVR
ncbi:hypothetical protein CXG81DRAFT_23625 [Caulochytrium protostelioides]|uniref:Uncharacterized protein n=1 Tax=Caulochytrium protostelioides TaxID=1555241 RepID=A0A4V1IVE6_9FUNG|nr:hypothetical protein CXG81DRAFT_23625 [Caulochytrium protostelioides]|eukprot:RKP03789.1 hypothetical protein CXG81DRAFT_23625 [Caulochytrium protostelioides]